MIPRVIDPRNCRSFRPHHRRYGDGAAPHTITRDDDEVLHGTRVRHPRAEAPKR